MNDKSTIRIERITRNILEKPVTWEKIKIQTNAMNEDRTNKNMKIEQRDLKEWIMIYITTLQLML